MPEALTQVLIHLCKGHIFAQIRMDSRWVSFDPKGHKGHEQHARVVYVVTCQIKDRQESAEILGAEYIHKPHDPDTFKKHKCEYLKVVCCLNTIQNKLHVTTCFTRRFPPRPDAPKHNISGLGSIQHARNIVFTNNQ